MPPAPVAPPACPLKSVSVSRYFPGYDLTRLALRLAGLRGHSRLRSASPDRRASATSGNVPGLMPRRCVFPARAALSRATGHSRLRSGSPDRRACAASGECARANFRNPGEKSVYWAKSVLKRESTALRSLVPSAAVGRIFSSLSSGRFAGTSLRAGISQASATSAWPSGDST